MSGPKVLAQVAEEVTAENFGDPVIYTNSSATVYGVVTINDQPAEAGDVVGFFAGTELRFKGAVAMKGGPGPGPNPLEIAANNGWRFDSRMRVHDRQPTAK